MSTLVTRTPGSPSWGPSTRTLDDALRALAGGAVEILAGGTDWYPALRDRAPPSDVLDLKRVDGLGGIERIADGWRIGALATWSELLAADLPPCFDALKAAAREVGSVQIQNAATLAGNLCTASPAADGMPPLLALDAAVDLQDAAGSRRLPLADFVLGPRQTALRPGELLVGLHVPTHAPDTIARFFKLGARRYLVISIAMLSIVLEPDAEGCIGCARIAVGACSPVARRLPALEARLVGEPMRHAPGKATLGSLVDRDVLAPLAPIDDVRADKAYRLAAVEIALRRLLDSIGEGRA